RAFSDSYTYPLPNTGQNSDHGANPRHGRSPDASGKQVEDVIERDPQNVEDKAEHGAQISPGRGRRNAPVTHGIEQPALHAIPQMRQEIANETANGAQDSLKSAPDKTYGRGQDRIPSLGRLVNQLAYQVDGNSEHADDKAERRLHGAPQIKVAKDLSNQQHD